MSKEASITVAVRIRPLNKAERGAYRSISRPASSYSLRALASRSATPQPRGSFVSHRFKALGARKILEAVDDRMLIFDPNKSRSLAEMDGNAFTRHNSPSIRKRALSGSRIGHHNRRNREHRFVFDRLFDEGCLQSEVYEFTGKPLIDNVLEGYNATVFAYGATGCGKTYTISGTPENPGVIFLTLRELFARIEECKDEKDIEVSLSYLEIYNETIRDLLSPDIDPRALQLREFSTAASGAGRRVVVTNLSEHCPTSVEEVMEMIVLGNRNRTVSATAANAVSSRSHAVLQITLVQKPRDSIDLQERQSISTFSFIDLAGSERASATKNRGIRLHEGANINKSLLALGNCINALCDTRRSGHIPYRDSKLTRLLKFSLGGNCKTVMIVCVSPSASHYDETLNALKYADRAKNIRTKVARNFQSVSKHVGSYLKVIKEQKREIELLRANKDKMVALQIAKFKERRTKCGEEVIDSLQRVERSLEKNDHIKMEKAATLAKKRFLSMQKTHVEEFLRPLQRVSTGSVGQDPIFKDLVSVAFELQQTLADQVEQLDAEYQRPSELDFILKDTTAASLTKLQELEGWSEQDEMLFNSMLDRISEAVERSLLCEAWIMFDDLVEQTSPFKAVMESLAQAFSIVFELSNSKEEISKDRHDQLGHEYHTLVSSCRAGMQDIMEGEYGERNEYVPVSPRTNNRRIMPGELPRSTPVKRNPVTQLGSPMVKKMAIQDRRESVGLGIFRDETSGLREETSGLREEISAFESPTQVPPDVSPSMVSLSMSPAPSLTARRLSTKIGSPGRLNGLGLSAFNPEELPKAGNLMLPFLLTGAPSTSAVEDSRMDLDDLVT